MFETLGFKILHFFNSRKDLHTLRERREEGAGQRGVVVPPLHVLRPARQLQATAANRDGSLQGQTQNALLLLGCHVHRLAGDNLR